MGACTLCLSENPVMEQTRLRQTPRRKRGCLQIHEHCCCGLPQPETIPPPKLPALVAAPTLPCLDWFSTCMAPLGSRCLGPRCSSAGLADASRSHPGCIYPPLGAGSCLAWQGGSWQEAVPCGQGAAVVNEVPGARKLHALNIRPIRLLGMSFGAPF